MTASAPTPSATLSPAALVDCLADLPDPCVERTRLHALPDILVIASLVLARSERQMTGKGASKVTRETRNYLSSLSGDARRAARTIRRHRGIENRAHWMLDVVFDDDGSRIRKRAAWDNAYLTRLLTGLLAI